MGEKENDPGTDPGKARGTLFSCPPVLRRSNSLGHWPVCVATWSLRVGHRAKPSRWRRNHSFIHLTNIYLAPPVCQAPCRRWDPEVNQPESQTQREWAGWGRQDTVGAWLSGGRGSARPLPGGNIETRYVQIPFFQEKPETRLHFQMNFSVIFKY